MDIQQPPRNADLNSSEMQRFLQDAYNGVKCPLFKVTRTDVSHWTIPGTGWNILPFNTVVYDTLGGWDITNYRFCPKIPGYYNIHSNVSIWADYTPTTGTAVIHACARNGTAFVAGNQINWANMTGYGGVVIPSSFSTMVYLNGMDDYVDLRIYLAVGSGTTKILSADEEHKAQFGGHKVTY